MSNCVSYTATNAAFGVFRAKYAPARLPPDGTVINPDERHAMAEVDGLHVWHDGPLKESPDINIPASKMIEQKDLFSRQLWAVRADDTVYAQETCDFGKSLTLKVIKHTNLTGGECAFCSGELLFVEGATVIINGQSRRYGPRSNQELIDVGIAFKNSGYRVAVMGFDDDTGYPLPFIGVMPTWL